MDIYKYRHQQEEDKKNSINGLSANVLKAIWMAYFSEPWQFQIVGSNDLFVKICSHSDR